MGILCTNKKKKMLKAIGIIKAYDQLEVLKGVDFQVKKGDVVSVVGASGAGKTTLLQILSTLDKPDAGEIYFKEEEITTYNEKKLARFRNKEIGFVFQFHHLLPEFTALENVCIPAFIAGRGRKETEAKALELLKMLGLSDRKQHKPSELSGGESQRIAIARALVNEPAIVFADEPTGNLDSVNRKELNQLFFDLRKQLGQTFVIVTHDTELANLTDKKFVMKDGLMIDG